MTDVATIARKLFLGALSRLSGMLFLLALILNSANAQNSSTDGSTPLGLAPGAPAGSYALSGFDNINLFNGNLNFSLPLLHVGGRGEARYTVALPIERHWRVDHTVITDTIGRRNFDVYTPDSNWWSSTPAIEEPHHGPGVLEGRQVGNPSGICDTLFRPTLTRLTFTAPDGTEYELRDQLNEGKPISAALVNQCNTTDVSRGIIFVTADGTAATFVSDAVIYDDQGSGAAIYYPSGYLMLRNGTRFRIDSGVVTWMRDRNGNRLSFTYDLFKRVTTITDSINRLVTITYADGTTLYDQITFKGFGGATRTIRVWHTNLGNALRQGYVEQTLSSLFPELNGASSSTFYNPTVTSAVELPDGRRYQFFYNSYGELARVVLPTGGAIEYDYGAGIAGGAASGVIQRTTVSTDRQYQIYRRVVERRVYLDGVTLEGKMTYVNSEY